MPVERTRRSGADGNKLIWTTPAEPDCAGGISFTENITPGSFVDPQLPELVYPADFEGATPLSPRRTGGHSRKKPENHIPRPPNAFILFRSSFIKSQHVSTEVETNHSTLSKIIGLTWKTLPEGERKIWHEKARQALDDHKRKYPTYSFRPTSSKGKGGEKRKVREVGIKDMKRCAKIAELLVEGKKGKELDEAIQEFDKHHVPEIITRFETPITERAFRPRRSSSVPPPELHHPEPRFLQVPSSPRKQKPVRHVSMSPEAPALPSVSFEAFSSYSIPPNNSPSIPNFDYNAFPFSTPSPQESSYSFDPVPATYVSAQQSMTSSLEIDTPSQFDWSTPLLGSPMTPEMLSGPASPMPHDEVYGTPTPFAPSSTADAASSFNMNPFLDDSAFKFNQQAAPDHHLVTQFFPDCHTQAVVPNLSIPFPPISSLADLGMNMGDMGHVMPLDPNFTNFMASFHPLELST